MLGIRPLLLAAPLPRAARAQVPLPEPGPASTGQQAALGQDVVVSVSEVNELSVSAVAVTLAVTATGSGETTTGDASTTFGVTTNGTGRKITGALSAPYAAGVSLSVELEAPPDAVATARVLGASAQDLLTGLTRTAASGLTVTYTATAEADAAPNAASGGETRVVTLTLTDG